MRKNHIILSAIAVCVMACGASALEGCSQGSPEVSRPAVGTLKEGLNILDASDPEWGFDAAFKKDALVVYFSTRVGVEKPEGYRKAWPSDAPNEMDGRFVDETGDTFVLQIGGDRLIDPTWAKDIEAGRTANAKKGDMAHRMASFALATELAKALADELGKSVPQSFVHHVNNAVGLASAKMPTETPSEPVPTKKPSTTGATDPGTVGGGGEQAYSTDGDYNQYYVEQYSGTVVYIPFYPSGCSKLPSPMGGCGSQQESWHTAERLWNYRYNNGSSYWETYVDACNHGRCAWNGLTYARGRWGNAGWIWDHRVDEIWTQSTNQDQSGTGVNGACQTSYSWNSGSGSHLCNDDSAYEVWQMDVGGFNSSMAWSTSTWNYKYTSYYTFSCTKDDSTARYACNGANVYRDWLPPCPF